MRISYWSSDVFSSDLGYYSVFLDTFKTQAELTATRWASVMRFTFPESERSNVIINFPRHGGTVEIVGDAKVRGVSEQSRATDGAYFVAEFSKIGRASCRERVCQYV